MFKGRIQEKTVKQNIQDKNMWKKWNGNNFVLKVKDQFN